MSAPFFTHMANRYGSPQNFNSQSTSYGKRPYPGFQWRPHTHFQPMNNSITESNDEHWCETCDRGFPTADMLEKHKQQHQKCSIDGCQFVAHPKVVTRHIQMQHASGLYKKISKLNNPEEIQKWREERKKKYPTRTNIEKKAAEYKEKVERGEKMALKQNRSKVDKSTDQPAARDKFNKKNENHITNKSNGNLLKIRSNKDQPPPKKVPKITPKVPSVVEKNRLKPFTGILSISMDDDDTAEDVCNLLNSDNNLIEEDEYNEDQIEQPIAKPVQEPVLCGALQSLMCDYGFSDEDDENDSKNTSVAIAVQPQKNDRLHENVETINNNCNIKEDLDHVNTNNLANVLDQTIKNQNDSDNASGPEEAKIVKMNIIEPPYTNNHMAIVNSNNKEDLENVTTNNLAKDLAQTIKNQNDSDDDSGPEEVKIVKMNIIEPPCTSSTTSLEISKTKRLPLNAKKSFPSRNDHRQHNRNKQKVPSTLLQKLLYKEIRQERNIVLQCIRYIKKMNYFDKPNE